MAPFRSRRNLLTVQSFHCIACHQRSGAMFFADCQDYYLGTALRVDYWKCNQCGLVQQSPMPDDTAEFYASYPIHSHKSNWFSALRRALMRASYYPIERTASSRRLLDYGCGDGWFLQSCQGLNLDLIGYERDTAHARNLSALLGLPVESQFNTLLDQHAAAIDVVTMNFVMEHLTDIDQAFRDVHALLKPGGEFYFSVPNIDSIEARIFKRKWHGLDPPRHISFPSEHVVRMLAQRHSFQVERVRNLPFPPGIAGSIPVVLTGKFRYPLFLLSMPLAVLINFLFPESARGYWLKKI